MKYIEVSGNHHDPALCSDDSCPCGYPGALIPRGEGYLYISNEVVEFREDCLSEVDAIRKKERLSDQLGARIIAGSGVFRPVLMCELGARKKGLNLEVAAADAKYWWETGQVPLRPTPFAGIRNVPPETAINDSPIKEWSEKMTCDWCKTDKESGASYDAETYGYPTSKIYICKDCIVSETNKAYKGWRADRYVILVFLSVLAMALTCSFAWLMYDILAGNADKFEGGEITIWFAIPAFVFFSISAFFWFCVYFQYSALHDKSWAVKRVKTPLPDHKSTGIRMMADLCNRTGNKGSNNNF